MMLPTNCPFVLQQKEVWPTGFDVQSWKKLFLKWLNIGSHFISSHLRMAKSELILLLAYFHRNTGTNDIQSTLFV